MNITSILPGLIAATVILSGCSGKDDPNATATSTSKGSTGTTGDTQGTTAGSGATTTSGLTTSPSTTDPTDTTGTASDTDTGCSFLGCGDEGSTLESCDMFAQDCPAGEKCMPWANDGGSSWNATKCSPLDPDPQQPGEVCSPEGGGVSGVDNCAKASMCWDVDVETNEGVCIAFCEGSYEQPTCDPGFRCAITGDGILILCLPDCDPLIQDCPNGETCLPTDSLFVCVLDASGEAGVYGDPCEFANACDPGLYCLPPEYVQDCKGAGCCSPFCDTSETNTCPGDTQECIPWYEEGYAPPGNEDIGICGVPQ